MTHCCALAHPADLEGFRTGVRAALAIGVRPMDIEWRVAGEPWLLPAEPLVVADAAPLKVPRRFAELAELVVCHADPARFPLLHQALVRLREQPRLLDVRSEPLVDRLEEMAKAVSRDRHKMRAFVRFREVAEADGPHFVAWFEPTHHIVRLNAGFFVRRFASQRWTILTPEESVHWDGAALHWLPGAARGDAPVDDPVEAVWKTYYASTFNPARLKVKAMQAEMPKKYWRNLPEAALIPELVAAAGGRTEAMIERGAADVTSDGSVIDGKAADAARRPGAADVTSDGSACDGQAVDAARRSGAAASPSPALLAEAALACTRCPLHGPATQTVFGEGPADARLMIVGEQPGDQEDRQGRPFVGPAGQLLDRALAEAGIDRGHTYVTNAVKHFKYELRGKRRIHASPTAGEIRACRWWLDQERAAVRPALVLMLGASAGRALMGRAVTVGRERGRLIKLPEGGRGFLTVHPSYLLRIEDAEAQRAEHARFVADLAAAAALADQCA